MVNLVLRVMRLAWRRWLRFAEVLGNIQMILILSLVYWSFLAVIALPFKLLADPLAMRRSHRARWVSRRPLSNVLESMRKEG
jgi:hypothetical protein